MEFFALPAYEEALECPVVEVGGLFDQPPPLYSEVDPTIVEPPAEDEEVPAFEQVTAPDMQYNPYDHEEGYEAWNDEKLKEMEISDEMRAEFDKIVIENRREELESSSRLDQLQEAALKLTFGYQ
ncbi:unnamed protein product [Bursaphelenchus okinawaensis]|uniref:Uncharacterized protein n=1 Tax=Bursaphelenchus okinawaensis TaxID=465554 RepID=A0A811KP03_9BILA|nr:unnamed protein product [Bursaphelenchus okinawaensis]CAG9109490.1 unnamed protein product [Bursaphelenchus okinawaensis]